MLTAEKLGIPQEYIDALILARDALRDGRIKHVDYNWRHHERDFETSCGEFPEDGNLLFNMDIWLCKADCGTVGCIGGTASALAKIGLKAMTDGLSDLFYPPFDDWEKITTEESVQAIDNYLNTGDPNWEEILV